MPFSVVSHIACLYWVPDNKFWTWKMKRENTKNEFIELICELIDDWLNSHTLWANGKWSINNNNNNHSIDQTCCYWILIGVGVWDEHKRKSTYIANFQPRQHYRSKANSSHFYWQVMRPLNEVKIMIISIIMPFMNNLTINVQHHICSVRLNLIYRYSILHHV